MNSALHFIKVTFIKRKTLSHNERYRLKIVKSPNANAIICSSDILLLDLTKSKSRFETETISSSFDHDEKAIMQEFMSLTREDFMKPRKPSEMVHLFEHLFGIEIPIDLDLGFYFSAGHLFFMYLSDTTETKALASEYFISLFASEDNSEKAIFLRIKQFYSRLCSTCKQTEYPLDKYISITKSLIQLFKGRSVKTKEDLKHSQSKYENLIQFSSIQPKESTLEPEDLIIQSP